MRAKATSKVGLNNHCWIRTHPRLRNFHVEKVDLLQGVQYDPKAILDSSGWHAESAKHKCQASSIGMFIDMFSFPVTCAPHWSFIVAGSN